MLSIIRIQPSIGTGMGMGTGMEAVITVAPQRSLLFREPLKK
jgi:hypothetical protein